MLCFNKSAVLQLKRKKNFKEDHSGLANLAVHSKCRLFSSFHSAILTVSACPPTDESHFLFLFVFLEEQGSPADFLLSHIGENFITTLNQALARGVEPCDWLRFINVSLISLPLTPTPPLEPISPEAQGQVENDGSLNMIRVL